jgi:hypothetical protein
MENVPTRQEIELAKAYLRAKELERLKIDAFDKNDFLEWLRLTAVQFLDEAEKIWRWIRRELLGLDID